MAEELERLADDDELTTVQISKGTSRKLLRLAKTYRRSKTEQVAFMVDTEMAKLAQHKLLPAPDDGNRMLEGA